jgi:hypothetical protein
MINSPGERKSTNKIGQNGTEAIKQNGNAPFIV